MTNKMSWRRWINRKAAPISAVVGILVVFSGVMFLQKDFPKVATIAAGLLIMQAGVWYMANPVLTSERRYTGLRDEIDAFIGLVRQFNQAVVANTSQEDIERFRQAMHGSVAKMEALAGKQTESANAAVAVESTT